MTRPRIIYFGSSVFQKQVNDQLFEYYDIICHPFDYQLRPADISKSKALVILFLSRYRKKGLAKLKELKSVYPSLPVIIIAEKPTQEDLLAAIRAGVQNFLLLPLTTAELDAAFRKALAGSRLGFSLYLGWSRRLWQQIQQFFKRLFEPKYSGSLHFMSNATLFSSSMKPNGGDLRKYDLVFNFLGNLEIIVRGKVLPPLSGKKNASLLAYLVFNHQKPVHKETIMSLFWGDNTPSSARNSLNVAIYTIRKHLSQLTPETEIILFNNDCYCINPELELISDVGQFLAYWQKGRAVETSHGLDGALGAYNKALALYKGDFLSEMRFEEWCESERDSFKETYLFILNRLAAYFFSRKEYDACISICKRMLEKDSCLEDAHRKLMECYYCLGLSDMAKHQFQKCAKTVSEEFGTDPSLKTKKLFDTICK